MREFRTTAAAFAVAAAGVLAAPAAAQAAQPAVPPGPDFEMVAAVAWKGECAKGDVCVWSGKNGTGTRCSWDGDDPDWRAGAVQCKPHGFRVNSIWNNGYSGGYDRVRFFTYKDYGQQISDPVPVTPAGINAGNIAIRSHQWST